MIEPWYKTNVETMHHLNLLGTEAMVYSALLFLCSRGPYKGSYQELAYFSCCGTDDTASRIVKKLIRKGFIIKDTDGIQIPQNAGTTPQIEGEKPQNAGISKEEKENQKKKENIKKEPNIMSSFTRTEKEESASPKDLILNRLFNMDVLFPGEKPKIPANTGYYKIIVLEYGYMNPKEFVRQFYNYWDGNGWPKNGNKLSLMRSWMDLYIEKHPKRKPSLNDIERAVMRTFLDNIEERLIVRLLHVVRQFEVTDKVIYFYVPESNVNDFVLWLNTLPLKLWFEAYNRTVSVRSLK